MCSTMAHPAYIRKKARRLRTEQRLSLDAIADRLALGKTTVWHWIKDLPDPEIKGRDSAGRRRGRVLAARANRERAAAARELAYRQGWDEFPSLDAEPAFRDFVCMYIGEGYKRCRNDVSICNSDPRVVALANHWIQRFTKNRIGYAFQYHADQDPQELTAFWSAYLNVGPTVIRAQPKSNSGQLRTRQWRCRWGVMAVRVGDTALRARLQAWMDRVEDGWIDSIRLGA